MLAPARRARRRTSPPPCGRSRDRLALILAVVAALFASLGVPPLLAAPAPPDLVFTAPASLAPLVERLATADPSPLLATMELVGLDDAGPPIRVELAEEGSVAARRAPSWGVGYAVSNAGLVVLLPHRIPTYPHGSLEEVLRHEVAHVLVARAARRHGVPRWFHEGVATYGAHGWRWNDRGRLLYAAMRHDTVSLGRLEQRFSGGADSASRAYALAAAFVRHLEEEHGRGTVAAILVEVARGEEFRRAFRAATGMTLAEAERGFWRHLDWWNRWVPFLTSSATLWMAVTALAVWAFRRRQRRDEEQRQRWEAEERWLEAPPSVGAGGDTSVN